MDGWNRIDVFNILANPYTTTRPAVTLGEREQFTQIERAVHRQVRARRPEHQLQLRQRRPDLDHLLHRPRRRWSCATRRALTASITGGSIGLPESVYTLDAPLDDATKAKVWTQELRLSGGKDRFQWVAGGFYSHTKRDYGQSLLVAGFEAADRHSHRGDFGAPQGRPVLLRPGLQARPVRALRRRDAVPDRQVQPDRRACATTTSTRTRTQVFDGIFARQHRTPDVAARHHRRQRRRAAPDRSYKVSDNTNLNAQVSKGFRLGGINDPLNVPLCTPAGPRDVRRPRHLEGREGLELRGRRRSPGSWAAAARSTSRRFYMDINDLQATVTAGSCSSRVIFNVPKARSAGVEVEFAAAPNEHFDFAISASYNDSELRSTVTSTDPTARQHRVGHPGGEPPADRAQVPDVAAAATYQWQMTGNVAGLR